MTRKGEKLKIKPLPFLPYDTKRRFLSNKKIQEKLNWKPSIRSLKKDYSKLLNHLEK